MKTRPTTRAKQRAAYRRYADSLRRSLGDSYSKEQYLLDASIETYRGYDDDRDALSVGSEDDIQSVGNLNNRGTRVGDKVLVVKGLIVGRV